MKACRPFVAIDQVDGGPNDGAPLIVIVAELGGEVGRIAIATEHPLDTVRLIAELMEAVREVDPATFAQYFEEAQP